jgi:hypothetical protein
MRVRLLLLSFGAVATSAFACTNDFDRFNFTGAGGAGPSSTTVTMPMGGMGPGGGGGGGSAPECMTAADCMTTDGDCNDVSCTPDFMCLSVNASPGVACDEGGGVICDGFGLCVECLVDGNCADPEAMCVNKECIAPDCMDTTMNQDETDTDCGGMECPACANGMMCLVPEDCQSLFCDVATCAVCVDDADCAPVPDTWCDGGVCSPKTANGIACSVSNECLSGNCPAQDGVCCDAACAGTCEGCTMIDTTLPDGTCGPIQAGLDPDNECTPGVGTCVGANCSGAASCLPASLGFVCNPAAGPCDAEEQCNGVTTTCPMDALIADGQPSTGGACDPYLCDGMSASCPVSCALPIDCVLPATCVGMTCQ